MEDFIKKYLRIIVLSVILLFALAFIIFYGTNDLFKFPFDSNVWGNAADWFMVLVTILTAFYLIKTFNEQKKITVMEYHKFLIENKPVPLAEINKRFELEISFTTNVPYDVKIAISHSPHYRFNGIDPEKLTAPFVPIGRVRRFVGTRICQPGEDSNSDSFIKCEIHFSDAFGNIYKEDFIGRYGKNLLKIPTKKSFL